MGLKRHIRYYEAITGKSWDDLPLLQQMHYAWGFEHGVQQEKALWELSEINQELDKDDCC